MKNALNDVLGDATIVRCRISHVYETSASLYFTVATGQSDASIIRHHAVGQDHKPWLAEEIGPVGVEMLRAVKERLDPTGVLNRGVLIP